jgi:hypothetical protein
LSQQANQKAEVEEDSDFSVKSCQSLNGNELSDSIDTNDVKCALTRLEAKEMVKQIGLFPKEGYFLCSFTNILN